MEIIRKRQVVSRKLAMWRIPIFLKVPSPVGEVNEGCLFEQLLERKKAEGGLDLMKPKNSEKTRKTW